jgi:hypothetical protein
VGKAWLSGEISSAFACVAIERAYDLSERARSEVGASPRALADSQRTAMSQECERLSRLIARLSESIDRRDRTDIQQLLAEIDSR